MFQVISGSPHESFLVPPRYLRRHVLRRDLCLSSKQEGWRRILGGELLPNSQSISQFEHFLGSFLLHDIYVYHDHNLDWYVEHSGSRARSNFVNFQAST